LKATVVNYSVAAFRVCILVSDSSWKTNLM
jgi:hypothetical protein